MSVLPTVSFGPHRVTRLISGGNPLCGNSHFSNEMDREMREYFTDEEVVRYLRRVEEAGIDTLQARGDYHRILHWVELHRRQGGTLQWIAQTASEMCDVFQNIRILAAAGVIGIYHHGTQTDRWWLEGKIDRVEDYLKCIRDHGVQVGLGTHTPEVIEYAEEKGWDLDFYMASLYNLNREMRQSALVAEAASSPLPPGEAASSPLPPGEGRVRERTVDPAPVNEERFLDTDPLAMCRVIRATKKTCLAFKIMAAGRRCASTESVREAFRFAFENIKPIDAVVVGMFPKRSDQVGENVAHVLATCTQ